MQVEVEIGMPFQILADDLLQVLVAKLNLVLDEPLGAVILHRVNVSQGHTPLGTGPSSRGRGQGPPVRSARRARPPLSNSAAACRRSAWWSRAGGRVPFLSIAIAKPGAPEATSQLCAMPVIQGIISADRP